MTHVFISRKSQKVQLKVLNSKALFRGKRVNKIESVGPKYCSKDDLNFKVKHYLN